MMTVSLIQSMPNYFVNFSNDSHRLCKFTRNTKKNGPVWFDLFRVCLRAFGLVLDRFGSLGFVFVVPIRRFGRVLVRPCMVR